MKNRIQEIESRLQVLQPSILKVIDESHHHIGHSGAKTGLGHFAVEISATAFLNKSLIERHRMVYAALGDLMKTDIHALRIVCISG